MDILRLLADMREQAASDLYLKVGLPPNYRIDGALAVISDHEPVTEPQMEEALVRILNDFQ